MTPTIRIMHDGETITSFDRDSHGAWREKPWTTPMWRQHDNNRPVSGDSTSMDEQLPHRARFYGVGLVDLPNGRALRVQAQSWQWHSGSASSTTHAQPVHGRKWDADRTIRVVYEFPGFTVRHEKLTPILDGLEAYGRNHVSVAALRGWV